MIWGCLEVYFGCLDLYFWFRTCILTVWTYIWCLGLIFVCLGLYLGVWTCILDVWTYVGSAGSGRSGRTKLEPDFTYGRCEYAWVCCQRKTMIFNRFLSMFYRFFVIFRLNSPGNIPNYMEIKPE